MLSNLSKARQAARKTKETICREIGWLYGEATSDIVAFCSVRAYHMLEEGYCCADPETMDKIGTVLGVEPCELFDDRGHVLFEEVEYA